MRNPKDVAALARSTSVDASILETLSQLVDLTRIQWVSPLVASMLLDAGYENAVEIAAADAEKLCDDLARMNAGNKYFKGKIGLRDIRRLVHAAGYLAR